MCSGSITKYSCGHESRKYYFQCPDGKNKHYQELLPHRLVGRRFRSHRLCDDCERAHRSDVESDASNIRENEESAKALLEYFRGERTWPVPDNGIENHIITLYSRGDRLHPWLNRGGASGSHFETARSTMESSFQDTTTTNPTSQNEGLRLWQEMLDRQTEIDRTRRPLRPDDRGFMYSELLARARAHEAENLESERARRQEALNQLGQGEFLGLYESDPEWLLNFGDWCKENCARDRPSTEIALRCDINGWFQHLRSCESRLRLDWTACAEAHRDGYLTMNLRCFNYYPDLDDGIPCFVTWRNSNESPEDTETTSPDSIFLRNLRGYEDYLSDNGWLDDLHAFQLARRTSVEEMRAVFSKIPGAPLSHFSATMETEEFPHGFFYICSYMSNPRGEGNPCTTDEANSHHSAMLRYWRLTVEALAFRDGHIMEYTIEREEILGTWPE